MLNLGAEKLMMAVEQFMVVRVVKVNVSGKYTYNTLFTKPVRENIARGLNTQDCIYNMV